MLAQATQSITFVPDFGPSYHVVYSVLFIVHLLLAIALLGALTHQSLALLWPARYVAPTAGGEVADPSITSAYRAVRVTLYTNAVIALYLITALAGAFLYRPYRLSVLPLFYGQGLKLFGDISNSKSPVGGCTLPGDATASMRRLHASQRAER